MKIDATRISSLLKLSIQINDGHSFSCAVSPPDGEVSFVDILPEIYTIHEKFLESTLENLNKKGTSPKCVKGCWSCCQHLITVSIHEAILIAHIVNMLGTAEKRRIEFAFDKILDLLEKKNLLKDLLDFHINRFEDKASISDIQKKYWNLKIPCPFLHQNACSIYPYRPLICRQYMVASNPINCHEIFKNDHLVDKIRLTHDFASAAASFDGVEAIKTRGIPLPIIFLINGILSYFPRSKTTAEKMIVLYLHHVDKHFRSQPAKVTLP